MRNWRPPEPITIDWQMRTIDTANVTAEHLADGRFSQRIEHAPLPGVTPAMCLWFLEHAGEQVQWRGRRVLAYRLWHPRDHIAFERSAPFAAGGRWHIVEAFGAERRFLMDQVFRVTSLDDTGFTMELQRLGVPVMRMDERWHPGPEGMRWSVEMTAGSSRLGMRSVTRAVIRRRMAFLERWRQHNVEEVGNLPHFLPELCGG